MQFHNDPPLRSKIILLMASLLTLVLAQPEPSTLSTNLEDTCFSFKKITPERSFSVWSYQCGDSTYTKVSVAKALSANQYTQGIMTTSKTLMIVGTLCACGGLLGGLIGLNNSDPVLAFSSVTVAYSGVGLLFSSIGLNTKAIKVYNKSICIRDNF